MRGRLRRGPSFFMHNGHPIFEVAVCFPARNRGLWHIYGHNGILLRFTAGWLRRNQARDGHLLTRKGKAER